jgi:hypothetical protein
MLGHLLTGCEERDTTVTTLSDSEVNTAVEKAASEEALNKLNAEKRELEEMVAMAKNADPNIISAYYTYDANGEKVLNVVRADDNDSNMTETLLMGAIAGVGASMLFNAIANNSQYHNPAHRQGMYQSQVMTKEKERERRSTAFVNYAAMTKANTATALRSNPSKMTALKSATLSTKQAAFKSTQAARASTVKASGG